MLAARRLKKKLARPGVDSDARPLEPEIKTVASEEKTGGLRSGNPSKMELRPVFLQTPYCTHWPLAYSYRS